MKATFEEIGKWITDFYIYIISVGLEGLKGQKGKGSFFFFPFLAIFIIIIYLVVKAIFY